MDLTPHVFIGMVDDFVREIGSLYPPHSSVMSVAAIGKVLLD